MVQRNKMSLDKREATRRKLLHDQMKECTFTPTITNSFSKSPGIQKENPISMDETVLSEDSNDSNLGQIYEYNKNVPVHERLYAMKDKSPRSNRIVHKTIDELDMEECTFQPKLAPYVPEQAVKQQEIIIDSHGNTATVLVPIDPPVRPPGWHKTVDRLRNAAAMRKPEEIVEEEQYEDLEKRYMKSKQIFAEGPKEFNFRGEKRSMERAAKKEKIGKPRMYVDVKNYLPIRLSIFLFMMVITHVNFLQPFVKSMLYHHKLLMC